MQFRYELVAVSCHRIPISSFVLAQPIKLRGEVMTEQELQDCWDRATRRFPVHTLQRAGVTWRYRVSGVGEHTLVALSGALGGAGAYFVLMTELETQHRLLSVDVPFTSSIREVMGGILDILDREGVERASFLGASFGGLLVQAFAKSHPERVVRLILAQTGPPGEIGPGKGRFWARVVSVLPTGLIRWLFERLVRGMLKRTPGKKFWMAFYSEEIQRLDRKSLASRYLLTSDLVESFVWTPDAHDAWKGLVTILFSRKDAMVGSKMRTALSALYPDADTHVFQTDGHAAYIHDPVGFSQTVASALGS